MNWNWWARSIAACMVGAVLAGCAAAGAPAARVATGGHVRDGNKYCKWEFDYYPGGKIQKSSLAVTQQLGSTRCEVRHLKDAIYIGDAKESVKKVTSVGASSEPVEIESEADSCKKCWVNSNGGLSCVWWDGNC